MDRCLVFGITPFKGNRTELIGYRGAIPYSITLILMKYQSPWYMEAFLALLNRDCAYQLGRFKALFQIK